jgi:hypothetical protein
MSDEQQPTCPRCAARLQPDGHALHCAWCGIAFVEERCRCWVCGEHVHTAAGAAYCLRCRYWVDVEDIGAEGGSPIEVLSPGAAKGAPVPHAPRLPSAA